MLRFISILHGSWLENIIHCHKNNLIKHKILTFLFLILNFRVENDFIGWNDKPVSVKNV